MNQLIRRALLLSLPLAVAAPAAAVQARSASISDRTLSTTIAASALTHLDVDALDGSVNLVASSDPAASTVIVSVALSPARVGRIAPDNLPAVELSTSVHSNTARLTLTNAHAGGLEAAWTIVVPARFSANIRAHDGTIAITGLEGGVEARVNAGLGGRGGKLVVDVPRGRLTLDVGVGDLIARRTSSVFDHAEVAASVGDASLTLLGHAINAPREPGPGHRLVLDGDGPESVRARVGVGNASLHIG